MTTNHERHAQLLALHEAASPAPWHTASADDQVVIVSDGRIVARLASVDDDQTVHDALLICVMRNEVERIVSDLQKRDLAIAAAYDVAALAYSRADKNRERAQRTDDEYAHGLATGQSKVAAALRRTLRTAMGEDDA